MQDGMRLGRRAALAGAPFAAAAFVAPWDVRPARAADAPGAGPVVAWVRMGRDGGARIRLARLSGGGADIVGDWSLAPATGDALGLALRSARARGGGLLRVWVEYA